MADGSWKGGADAAGGLAEGMWHDWLFRPQFQARFRRSTDGAQKIVEKKLAVYAGPLRDNTGKERVATGQTLSHDDIMAIDWLVEGVR